jgi:hypothetical protein
MWIQKYEIIMRKIPYKTTWKYTKLIKYCEIAKKSFEC